MCSIEDLFRWRTLVDSANADKVIDYIIPNHTVFIINSLKEGSLASIGDIVIYDNFVYGNKMGRFINTRTGTTLPLYWDEVLPYE